MNKKFKKYPSFGDSKRTHDYAGNVVPKNSEYVILMGKIDFIKAGIQIANSYLSKTEHKEMLNFLSRKLWQTMGELSLGKIGKKVSDPVSQEDIKQVEHWIDTFKVPDSFVEFTKKKAVYLNDARTRWRQIEPELISYGEKYPLRNEIYSFFNRAGDLLFLLACYYENEKD